MGTHPIFESDFDCLTGMKILGYICVGTVLGSSNTDNLRVTKYVGTKSAKKFTKTNRLADFETNIPEVFSEWELSVKLQLKSNSHSDRLMYLLYKLFTIKQTIIFGMEFWAI